MTYSVADVALVKEMQPLLPESHQGMAELGLDAVRLSEVERLGVLLFASLGEIHWESLSELHSCQLLRLMVRSAGALQEQWYPLARRQPRSYEIMCAMADRHSECYDPVRIATIQDILCNVMRKAMMDAKDPVARKAELLRSPWMARPEGAIARFELERMK